MHVPTHILTGWCAASLFKLTPRERLCAMIAASAADLDGISLLFGEGTYQTYHHLLGHNLLFAGMFAIVLAQFATNKLKAFVLYLGLAHLHLLLDYFGSGPFWPIYYLWPFSGRFYFINKEAWPFTSWQNTSVAGAMLAWTIYIAYRRGRTPLELITPRLDRQLVSWMQQPTPSESASLARRSGMSFVLALHACGSIAWLLLMPRGFPMIHPRFWVNQVLPWATLLFITILILARWRRGFNAVAGLLLTFPLAWFCAAISATVIFPISARWLAPMLLLAAVIMLSACWPTRRPHLLQLPILLIAVIVAALLPLAQRGGAARTRPLNPLIDPIPPGALYNPGLLPLVPLRHDLRVQSSDGTLYFRCGQVQIDLQPMLTFTSRSPDRCWTIFAPRNWRKPLRRSLAAMQPAAATTGGELRLWFDEDDSSFLFLTSIDSERTLIESRSHLSRPVYSHLNAHSELTIMGHQRLQIAFSPCGPRRFEVRHAGYPFGKPARVAYFDGNESFRVVEASSAEKGPFHELASGRLRRDDPLTITLFDDGVALARFTFDDWSAQASDGLSPTAGWGLPQNSIQFELYDDRPTSPAGVWLSLADTGVGRGWDTVGHAPGTYRNRVHVQRLRE